MIRKGFVSNSSSSSFIISYNRDNIVKGAENIVNFIKDKLNRDYEMYLYGGAEYGEGDLLFKLEDTHKSLIRKYRDEFINHPNSSSYVLYYGEETSNSRYIYEDSLLFKNFDEGVVANLLGNKRYWEISTEEYNEAIDKHLNEIREATPNREAKRTWISYNLDVDDEEFFNLFLSDEEECDRSWMIDGRSEESCARPYALSYKERISNKEEIVQYLKYSKPDSNLGLCWLNEVYEDVTRRIVDLEMYVLGSEEIEYLISHEESFLENSAKISLFIDYRFYKEAITINSSDVGKNLVLRSGNFKEVVDCFDDFADVFFKGNYDEF